MTSEDSPSESASDESLSGESATHTASGSRETSYQEWLLLRRRSILGVLGISALAGCSALEEDEERNDSPDEFLEDPPVDEIPDELEILIEEHIDSISGKSYTLDIEYNGDRTAGDETKQIEYEHDEEGDVVRLQESSTISNGINEVVYLVTNNELNTTIRFDEYSSQRIDRLSEDPDYFRTITGESLFRSFLTGTIGIDPAESVASDMDRGDITSFEIVEHSRYDDIQGHIEAADSGIITEFYMEWLDSGDNSHWIAIEVRDIGTTTVDTAGE